MMIKYLVIIIGILLVLSLFAHGIPVLRSEKEQKILFLKPQSVPINADSVRVKVPAVTEEGEGIMAEITVDMIPGTGRTLMDIDNILFLEDTQNSIRLANLIAENITGVKLSENDVVYSVKTNATAIEGSSAGTIVSIATIALIENKSINQSVTMTGYLKSNGKIGKVSSVFEKAKVSKDNGYDLFLVPSGQEVQEEISEIKLCKKIIFRDICRTVVNKTIINIEKAANIEIVEVSNILEAMDYLII